MPTKARKKGSKKGHGTETSQASKTLDAYFPRTPSTDNNNEAKLEVTSETVFYYHGSGLDDVTDVTEKAKEEILSVGCLSTPEVSPEKAEPVVKTEATVEGNEREERVTVEDSKELTTSSSSHTSNSSDCSTTESTTSNHVKPKRRGNKSTKSEAVKPQQNTLLTDFFPVRKSSRKTAKELQREHDELVRNLILDNWEDGLEIVQYEGKGRGIEASKPFAKGDFVVEYAGELISPEEAKIREQKYKSDTSFGCYMYFFTHHGKRYCIDATVETGRKGRLLNHSRANANCMTRTLDVGDRACLLLVAARDIEAGEELVYDYGDRSKEALANNPWLRE